MLYGISLFFLLLFLLVLYLYYRWQRNRAYRKGMNVGRNQQMNTAPQQTGQMADQQMGAQQQMGQQQPAAPMGTMPAQPQGLPKQPRKTISLPGHPPKA